MGKSSYKKKKHAGGTTKDSNLKKNKPPQLKSKALHEDETIFKNMAQELKEEGNILFQKRDHEGAMLKYEKALNLLPSNDIDVALLHSSMAACYMQMSPSEYQKAIYECNLALQAFPNYSKALLKRARCYEALNRLKLALRDGNTVLACEPNNIMALEIIDRVKKALEKKGVELDEKEVILDLKGTDIGGSSYPDARKQKTKKKKCCSVKRNNTQVKDVIEGKLDVVEEPSNKIKLVFGEDIRWAQVPASSNIMQVRNIIKNHFPSLEAFHLKYKDQEGDFVTITSTEELRWAEESCSSINTLKLYALEVMPDQDRLYEEATKLPMHSNIISIDESDKYMPQKVSYREDWIDQFARMFKNHVGFKCDDYLDLHEVGAKLYYEAIEDIVTSEEAQDYLEIAASKFQEMAALAFFNWGNVHMSKARKRFILSEDVSSGSLLTWAENAYEWSRKEYEKAGEKYKEAIKIKHDFYEGFVALAQQQFEQAKLSWYFAIGTNANLRTWPSVEVIELLNNAEMNIKNGYNQWEQIEEQSMLGRLKKSKEKERTILQGMGLLDMLDGIAADIVEKNDKFRSQIYLLWGNMLYERSMIEYKLDVEYWEDCLDDALEKFEYAGVSSVDIAVLRKNHCSNSAVQGGIAFKVDEIFQAWNEMDNAKQWLGGVSLSRLEPLLRRRTPEMHNVLESFCSSS